MKVGVQAQNDGVQQTKEVGPRALGPGDESRLRGSVYEEKKGA